MYLAGMNGSMTIRMPDGSARTVTAIGAEFAEALAAGGVPMGPGGIPYRLEMFQGGYLFDECPGNVVLGNGWMPGQEDALRAAGKVRCLPAGAAPASTAAPVVTTPERPVVPSPLQNRFTAGGVASSGAGARRFPTGMATPSIVTSPQSAPRLVLPPPELQAPAPEGAPAAAEPTNWTPWLIAGGLALILLRR